MIANPWLHRLALFTVAMTWLLLCAGALVTGTGSGLSVPDWPLSYGQFMPPMVGGVFFEHGHRLIAGTVGILTAILCAVTWIVEARGWVRWLSTLALFAVVTQAVLGGMTVLYRLPTAVSVTHACLAQVFFSMTLILALVTSPTWQEPLYLSGEPEQSPSFPLLCASVTVLFFIQLALGAVMRHTGSGLAVPDFPTVFGGWWPASFSFPIAIHLAHRFGAYLLVVLVGITAVIALRRYYTHFLVTFFAGAMAAAVAAQVVLGASILWLKRPVPITTLHLAVGAVCLATSACLSLVVFRVHGLGVAPGTLGESFRSAHWVLRTEGAET